MPIAHFLRTLFTVLLSVSIFTLTFASAKEPTQAERNEMAAKLIPIITMLLMDDGDTKPPLKPVLTANAPTQTFDETVTVEVNGEVGSKVFVNGTYVATIASNGKVEVSLDLLTPTNAFTIVLKDSSGNTSDALTFSVDYIAMKIQVSNGALQVVPFDFNATISNLPQGYTAQWYIDGNNTNGQLYTIDTEGTYYVTAKILDTNNTVVKTLNTDLVGHVPKLVTSFVAKEANETSNYVYEDQNSTLSGVSLLIPKNALTLDTVIELKESKAPNIPNLGRSAISKVLTLEPAGLQFEKPILVSVPYEGNITRDNIVVARYSDGVTDTILPYSVDEEHKIVTFKTEHFTSFSLQESFYIDKDFDEQEVIQRIIELTKISSINTNKEWEDILNTVLVEKGDYRVYDMYLEYDKQLRMSDEITAGNYAQGIKIMFPEKDSPLDKEIESMKFLRKTLNNLDIAMHFDVREITAGGLRMSGEIFSAVASLLGLPTSPVSLVNNEFTNMGQYISKPVDVYAMGAIKVQNSMYSAFWSELNDEYPGGTDKVMAYDASTGSFASFMGNGTREFTKDMIHNLKLIFLKNKHFIEYKDIYLQNLITTIKYYHESEVKSVVVRPVTNHQAEFISSAEAYFRPEFKAKPNGYSQDSFLAKHPRITMSYNGNKLGTLNFKEKNDDGSYTTRMYGYENSDNIPSFATAGDYVLDWKYNDDEGVERNGKYYVKFVGPRQVSIGDYKIVTNNISNTDGFVEAVPIFDSNDYIEYDTEIQLGTTILKQSYKTGIKIPNYADMLSGALGQDKLDALKHAKIKFFPRESSTYTFDSKEFEVDLLAYALEGNGGVFDDLWLYYLPSSNTVPIAPATIRVRVDILNSDIVPSTIDYDGNGIYDKQLSSSDVDIDGILNVDVRYAKKGAYQPCIKFVHTPTKLSKRICFDEDYYVVIAGEDEPVVAQSEIPELVASRTSIVENNVITFTLDTTNVDTSKSRSVDMQGDIIAFEEANGAYVLKVQYPYSGVFFPSIEVYLNDGVKRKIKSKIIKVGIDTSTITHNNTTYGTVTSPYTGKVWLDRNLGASQVCTAYNDTACYGDYYQWGRNFDGHQSSTSGTTSTQATNVSSAGSSFITTSSSPYDWTTADSDGSLRSANWSKTDGTSVCPVGFRVPTIAELKAELLDAGSAQIANNTDAFNSFLKLPSAGYRYDDSASLNNQGSWGYVWSGSVSGSFAHHVLFDSDGASSNSYFRALGFAVRCLRD